MYKAFLIKYAEIGIKGKNRHLFEDALVRQICYVCAVWMALFMCTSSRDVCLWKPKVTMIMRRP